MRIWMRFRVLTNLFRNFRGNLGTFNRGSAIIILAIKLIGQETKFLYPVLICKLPHAIPHFRLSHFISGHRLSPYSVVTNQIDIEC